MLQPNALILYVGDLAKSSQFYGELLELAPQESSPTFTQFSLKNGMGLGLKDRSSVQPEAESFGQGEMAFIVESSQRVNELYKEWQNSGIPIGQAPVQLPYGYTFVGFDPDGNRLRVVSLDKISNDN